ncbi:hypothetical protein [Amycolatopsis echigonensis]|uniref:Uncharacterized protein n=1 Tax=Amycolatopsis echigonensis TaxID=2576905 RepID=A0A8E1VTF8_9PSEU|nr:hypothetical protein [Amycolatopsis echigonensis]MBB2497618.1 hypothetical protein [Amycolatopsis echigonensis]
MIVAVAEVAILAGQLWPMNLSAQSGKGNSILPGFDGVFDGTVATTPKPIASSTTKVVG